MLYVITLKELTSNRIDYYNELIAVVDDESKIEDTCKRFIEYYYEVTRSEREGNEVRTYYKALKKEFCARFDVNEKRLNKVCKL